MRLFFVLGLLLASAFVTYSKLSIDHSESSRRQLEELPLKQANASNRSINSNSFPAESPQNATLESRSKPQPEALETSPYALAGTSVPGKFSVDGDGQLIVTQDAKSVFDYFLLLQGTEAYSEEDVLSLIENHLQANLSGDALNQALQLLDRYMSYRNDLENVMLGKSFLEQKESFHGQYQSEQLASVEHYYSVIDELKSNYFDQHERDVFFSEEEQYTRYMLKRLEIANQTTSDLDKQHQLADLDTRQDEAFLEQRAKSQSLTTLKKITSSTSDPYAQQYALAETFGEEKAQAIMEVEQNRSSWKEKKAQYFALRDKIQQSHSYYTQSDVNQLMDSYMATDLGFSPSEIKRMQLLEGR